MSGPPVPAATPRQAGGGGLYLALTALLAAALWLAELLLGRDVVMGGGPGRLALEAAAVAVTAAFAVGLAGRAALALLPSGPAGPTGLQRFLAYGLAAFVAAFLVLQHYGFDLRTVLAGSAIATAAIGLALQPTLGSMIAGLALQMDRVLKVGDAVLHDGEPVLIVRLDWRTAVGRKANGRLVVFPNARLSDAPLEVLSADGPVRADVAFQASSEEPPQRVGELVRDLIADIGLVDLDHPVLVAPTAIDGGHIQYRASFQCRGWVAASLAPGEVLRRLWYLFQRHGVALERDAPLPVDEDLAGQRRQIAAALRRAGRPETGAAGLAASGRPLRYAPDEVLTLPDWAEGHSLLLIAGRCRLASEFETVLRSVRAPGPLPAERAGRRGRLVRITEALTAHIGPYAELAVARAAPAAADLGALCQALALEIDDEAARQAFLAATAEAAEPTADVGPLLTIRRSAAGPLITQPSLRALDEVSLWAWREAARASV